MLQLFQEDELSKVISSCRVEGNVLSTWINFMEDTWALQCSYTEAKRKEAMYATELIYMNFLLYTYIYLYAGFHFAKSLILINGNDFIFVDNCYFAFSSDELETHEDYFVNLVIQLLSAYEVWIYFAS